MSASAIAFAGAVFKKHKPKMELVIQGIKDNREI